QALAPVGLADRQVGHHRRYEVSSGRAALRTLQADGAERAEHEAGIQIDADIAIREIVAQTAADDGKNHVVDRPPETILDGFDGVEVERQPVEATMTSDRTIE